MEAYSLQYYRKFITKIEDYPSRIYRANSLRKNILLFALKLNTFSYKRGGIFCISESNQFRSIPIKISFFLINEVISVILQI